MIIQENLTIQEKLKILTDAAKYDVACTSSGVQRRGKKGHLGNSSEAGICHSFAADGRCISLLKILFTNQCIYDCKYCVNRCTNDTVRTAFTPDEVCQLTMEFYRRNYIEGLFLSSGILSTADHTMELIYETLYKLRNIYCFNGYIHVKSIPGASRELVEKTGFLADRMSINLELPTAAGLRELAPGKTREKILAPMRQVQQGIALSGRLLGYDRGYRKMFPSDRAGFAGGASLIQPELTGKDLLMPFGKADSLALALKDVPGITVILTGGIVTSVSSSIEGLLGEDLLTKIHTDIAFVSARGFSVENGLTDFSIYEADLKRRCVKSSAKTIALIDHTKFNTTSISSYASLDDLNMVITDFGLSEHTKSIYENAGVNLVLAKEV